MGEAETLESRFENERKVKFGWPLTHDGIRDMFNYIRSRLGPETQINLVYTISENLGYEKQLGSFEVSGNIKSKDFVHQSFNSINSLSSIGYVDGLELFVTPGYGFEFDKIPEKERKLWNEIKECVSDYFEDP